MKEVLFIKARQKSRQKSRQNPFNRELLLNLTQAVSIENYEIRFSRSDYTHILEYLCKVYFLTTLYIYKNYFKSRQEIMQSDNTCIL